MMNICTLYIVQAALVVNICCLDDCDDDGGDDDDDGEYAGCSVPSSQGVSPKAEVGTSRKIEEQLVQKPELEVPRRFISSKCNARRNNETLGGALP